MSPKLLRQLNPGALQSGREIVVANVADSPGTAPHLHFEVHRLGPEKHWWKGAPINPFEALRNGDALPVPVPSAAAPR